MKSVNQLSNKLKKQWLLADNRQKFLLSNDTWPLKISIGKPSALQLKNNLSSVKAHISEWRKLNVGVVEWSEIKYQSATTAIKMPIHWCLNQSSDWIDATMDKSLKNEFDLLIEVLEFSEPIFHSYLVRHRSLWKNANNEIKQNLIQCVQIANKLHPNMANGKPLRAISVEGMDSKFLENNEGILTALINKKYHDLFKGKDLRQILNASTKGEHWILVKPLSKGLLPFTQLRLTANELAIVVLPASNIIVIENEQCLHQLPSIKDTIAILGAGLNLYWLKNPSFLTKKIIYWGDIDTWGLKMLALARKLQPQVEAILMDREIANKYVASRVKEAKPVEHVPRLGLNKKELSLFNFLKSSANGRLEQEFISATDVELALKIKLRS